MDVDPTHRVVNANMSIYRIVSTDTIFLLDPHIILQLQLITSYFHSIAGQNCHASSAIIWPRGKKLI